MENWYIFLFVCCCIVIICVGFILVILYENYKKKKNIQNSKLTQEQYGQYVAYLLSLSEEGFFKSVPEIEHTGYNSITYYAYYIFLCKQILLKKYSENFVHMIIRSCEKHISKRFEEISKGNAKSMEFEVFLLSIGNKLLSESLAPLNNPDDFNTLAKLFMEDVDNKINAVTEMKLISNFTTFVTYHLADILNDKIKIKDN